MVSSCAPCYNKEKKNKAATGGHTEGETQMNENLKNFGSTVKEKWESLTTNQKWLYGGIAAVVLVNTHFFGLGKLIWSALCLGALFYIARRIHKAM